MYKDEQQFNLYDGSEPPTQYISAMTSNSHTYGNMVAFIQNWIIRQFPKDYFKTIHVNSKLSHLQMRNTPHEYNKKLKPILAISPRVDNDDDRFLKSTPLTEHRSDLYSIYGGGQLMSFFDDTNREMSLKYQLNRSVMYTDVIIILSTQMQQIDVMNYIRNTCLIDIGFNISTVLESFIPEDILNEISRISNVPMYNEEGYTIDFLKYMKERSIYPVTYRMSGARNKKEFYRFYPVTIDTLISNLSVDTGDRQGQINTNYKITFSIRTEFYTTGYYYLFSNQVDPYIGLNGSISKSDGDIIVPIFTDVMLKEDFHLENGWSLYNHMAVELEKSDDVVEVEVAESVKACVNYYFKNGLPIVDLVNIKIRKQGDLLIENTHYTVDYETMKVTFINAEYQFYTYTIYVSVNMDTINNRLEYLITKKTEPLTY